jgi:hypothetical protein
MADTSSASDDESEEEESSEESKRLRAAQHVKRAARHVLWEQAGHSLAVAGWAAMDGFLGAADAESIRAQVRGLRDSDGSLFVLGRTGGGHDGNGKTYSEQVVRGDRVARLNGDDDRVPGLRSLLHKADQLVRVMARSVPELRQIVSRSQPMLACYPGNGAGYIRHVDNPGGNQRVLVR